MTIAQTKERIYTEEEYLEIEIAADTLNELLHKNRSEVSALLSEIIEDMAMEKAIAEGENTELVSRELILEYLEHIF